MESGKVIPFQQEIDRSRNQARASELGRQRFPGDGDGRTVALAIVPALGMRDKVQPVDPVLGGFRHEVLV